MNKIIQLYSDKNKTIKAYPKTLASQVYMDDGQTTITSQLDSIEQKKANSTDVIKKGAVTLNECDVVMLNAIKGGAGANFNILSIPRDRSVSPTKTDFMNLYVSKNLYNSKDLNIQDGKTVDLNGYIVSSSNKFITHQISCSANKYIVVSYIFGGATTYPNDCSFAFYSSDGTFMKSSYIQSNSKALVPVGASYLIISISNTFRNADFNFMIEQNDSGIRTTYEPFYNYGKMPTSYIERVNEVPLDILALNIFYDGAIDPLSGGMEYIGLTAWKRSKFVYLKNVSRISYSLIGTDNISTFAFYDENKTFISSINGTVKDTLISGNVTIPSNAIYMKICYKVADTSRKITVYYNEELGVTKVDTFNDNINSDYFKYLFNNGLFIGDSLTKGDYGTPHSVQQESYPYFMNKITGINVTNVAVPGHTISQQWDVVKTYNFVGNKFDSVFICLGTNAGLTDTIEQDTQGNDYMNYANTHTGNYCKIIEHLKANIPNVKIFIISTPSCYKAMGVWNVIINKIASKYNLPYLNIYENGSVTKDNYLTYTNVTDTLHRNRMGYLLMAQDIISNMCNYISKNPIKYNDLLSK